MKKPNNYWTFEKCSVLSLSCISRMEFKTKYPYPYGLSVINGWLDDICSHMVDIRKPKGHWSYERCKEEALKFNNRSEFNKESKSCYLSAYKNGWLDDICVHMVTNGHKYKRCIYCYEFPDNHVYVGLTYNIEKRQHNRNCDDNDQVTKYIRETSLKPIRKQLTEYIYVVKAVKMEEYYVNEYINNGWYILNKSKTGGLGSSRLFWTSERCHDEALKYKSRTEFKIKSTGAYYSSIKHGCLDNVCSHMISITKPNNYWTYERCKEEALKYNKKTPFIRQSRGAYNSAHKNGWIDDICSHIKKKRKTK